jgi:hypothetical protein
MKKAITENSMMDADAATYLTNSNTSLWARSALPVPRFGCVTSNSAVSLNSWMEPLRTGSHLNALVKWISQVTTLFFKRKQELMTEAGVITEKNQLKLLTNLQDGRRMNVTQFSEVGFQIINPRTNITRIVSLKKQHCSCGDFCEWMFPC